MISRWFSDDVESIICISRKYFLDTVINNVPFSTTVLFNENIYIYSN